MGVLQMLPQKFKYIIGNYYEQLHANKQNDLEQRDELLETSNLPRLNKEEIERMNRPITSMEIESVIKSLLTTKPLEQMTSMENFTKH